MTAKPVPASGKIALRRQAVIRAARAAFLREGYGCSMDAIAAEAGVSRRTLFYGFKSKEQLFLAVLDDAADVESLVLPLDPDREVGQMLIDFGRHYAELACRPDVIALRRILQSEATRFPETVGLVSERYFAALLPPLAAYLQKLIDRGRLSPADPLLLAEQFLAMAVGFDRMRALLGAPVRRGDAAQTYLAAAVRTFLRGAS